MKNNFITKIIGATLGAAMMIGAAVGVSNKNEARPIYADEIYKSAIFTKSSFSANSQAYTGSSFYSTTNGFRVDITNANNNNKGWDYIKIGGKNGAYKGTIETHDAIDKAVKSVSMTIDAITAASVNSMTLYSSSDGSSWNSEGTFVAATGAKSVNIASPATNKYYKIDVDCKKGSSNGLVQISRVDYYTADSVKALTNIELSGAAANNSLNIGSSDNTAKTINVSLTPSNATDQKINIKHQSGNELFTIGGDRDITGGKQIDCTSGSGSFTITGTGAISGSETFRISGNTETSVYVDLTVTALNDSVTYYTVSFDADGAVGGPANILVEDGQTFSFPSPGTKEHYWFRGWTSDGDNFFDEGDTSPAVVGDIEYLAWWEEDAKYTVTYNSTAHGLGSYIVNNVYEGDYELLPFADLTGISAYNGYRFKNYKFQGNAKNPGDTIVLDENITIDVNFEKISADTLTAALINRSTYGNWSDISGASSSAVYAGNSTRSSHQAIQMRSDNSNSGIVSTTSGGTIKAVTLTWNADDFGNSPSRTLNVYAKNAPYSAATDLYDEDERGTLVGTITRTNSTTYETELEITGDYSYIGVRSNNGALYLDEINFEWTTFRETIETLDTETQLSYRYTKDGNNYDYSDISMRFGGCINKDLWTSLDTDSHVISGFGVMIASTNVIHSPYTIKDKANSAVAASANNDYANTLVDFYMPKASMATPAEDGDDYYWNLFFSVDFDEISINKYYVTAAYIKVDGEYVFMKEVKYSVTSLAQDYLDHRNCDGATAEGSLAKLASLSPAE